jgi:hypothetical protein
MDSKDAKDLRKTLERSLSEQFNSQKQMANKGYSYSTQIVLIEEDEAGRYRHETWLDAQGKPHRNGGPAISLVVNGAMEFEEWRQHGVMHRDDGPALFQKRGCVIVEDWYRNGVRIAGPGQGNPAPKV